MGSKESVFHTKLVEAEDKKATNCSSLIYREDDERIISRLNVLKQANPTEMKHDYRSL